MKHFPVNMPAEWTRHEATWLAWPHNRTDWPGKMNAVTWAYAEMVRHLVADEKVNIIVESIDWERRVKSILGKAHIPMDNIVFHRWRTNRGWTRDFGPLFVRDPKGVNVIVDFGFNGWARYSDWKLDTSIPARAARMRKTPLVVPRHKGRHVVLEGGGIDVNGYGTILATEECWLDPNQQVRNPGFTKADYEKIFDRYLGTPHTIWLGAGIAGDDTHGHVDDLCRFINRDTVVLATETNKDDPNYRVLNENRERLQQVRIENGTKLKVIDLPMPSPVWHEGRRLPASYANFYISNAAVLVPTFNDPNDRTALGILAACFSDRPVIGIHAVDLVWGLGTLHCLTQQEPARNCLD